MRRLVHVVSVWVLAAVAVAVTAPPASASAKPKPITKTYTATAQPDPTSKLRRPACASLIPVEVNGYRSFHDEPFTVPSAGTLKVVLRIDEWLEASYSDWDLVLFNARDRTVIAEAAEPLGVDEVVTVTFEKKTDVVIRVCNVMGSPSATVTYRFRFE